MKKYQSSIIFLILSIGVFYFKGYPQIEEKYYDCKVVNKLQTNATCKIPAYFYLIVIADDKTIDLSVGPGLFAQSYIGEKITFKLSERHFDTSGSWDAGWVILSIIFTVLSVFNFLFTRFDQ